MRKKALKILVKVAVICLGISYAMLPEYKEYSSNIISFDNARNTELKLIVYKARYNPILYDNIAGSHNKLNGTPTKLILRLYRSKWSIEQGHRPYRIIVYEYDRNLKYILLE